MKRIKALWGLTATLLVAGVLILGACFNPLTPPAIGEAGGPGSLTITVGGTPDLVRTLYPRAEFTSYELSFSPNDGQEPYVPVTFTGQNSTVITGLPAGSWDISAKGFVNIEGQVYEAASETKEDVVITGGTDQTIIFNITAKPMTDGGRGYFSYSVEFPDAKVDYAYLNFTAPDDSQVQTNPAAGAPEHITAIDLISDGTTGTIPLTPGYYLVRIQLGNQYQAAGKTEVVHIYPNLETRGEFVFRDEDFADTITLSGNVDVRINNVTPDFVSLEAYTDFPGQLLPSTVPGQFLAGTGLGPSGDWSLAILPFDTPTEVSFRINASFNDGSSYSWNIGHQLVESTSLPGLNFVSHKNTITLSGTVNVTVGQLPLDHIVINTFPDSTCIGIPLDYAEVYPASSPNWSITMLSLDAQTDVYFELDIYPQGGGNPIWYQTEHCESVYQTDISGITLGPYVLNYITLSGTVDVTVDGLAPDHIQIQAYDNAAYTGNPLGFASVSPSFDGNQWSMTIDSFPVLTDVYFTLSIQPQGGGNLIVRWLEDDPKSVYNQGVSGIDWTFDIITLSGTVDVTVDGAAPEFIVVAAYDNAAYTGNPLGSASISPSVDGNQWSMTIDSFPVLTDVYFELFTPPMGGELSSGRQVEDPESVYNQGVSGIDLGTFDLITLSGMVDVTVDGVAPDSIQIAAYDNADYTGMLGSAFVSPLFNGNQWSMTIDSFSALTDVYFTLIIHPQGGGNPIVRWLEYPESVYNQGVIGIDWTFDIITLSGTVDVTVDGAAPEYIQIGAYDNAAHTGNSLAYVYVFPLSNGNQWSMTIDSFSTFTDVYFELFIQPQGGGDIIGRWLEDDPESVYNQGVSGIDWTFDIITLSGTVDVTVDGLAPHSIQIQAYDNAAYTGNPLGSAFISSPSDDGNQWSMTIDSLSASTDVYFKLIIHPPGGGIPIFRQAEDPESVYNQGVSGIDLGTFNLIAE
jgi:hypothetical protein